MLLVKRTDGDAHNIGGVVGARFRVKVRGTLVVVFSCELGPNRVVFVAFFRVQCATVVGGALKQSRNARSARRIIGGNVSFEKPRSEGNRLTGHCFVYNFSRC